MPPQLQRNSFSSNKVRFDLLSAIAVVLLAIFIFMFLGRVNASSALKTTVIFLSLVSVWQLIFSKRNELFLLLLVNLGLLILYTFYKAESVSIIWLVTLSAMLAAFATLWQGIYTTTGPVLWRNVYLIGFLIAESSALLAYWIVYDDALGKAILTTLILYVCWGVFESCEGNELNWRTIAIYFAIASLLGTLVIGTMVPILGVSIH